MALFDALIDDIASRFGLGAHAAPLVREILDLVVNRPQGLSGFIDRLKSAGLGSEVASWLGNGDAAALPTQLVESLLGSTLLSGLASKLGLSSSLVAPALAYIVPKLIGLLTPGGVVPAALPAAVASFLSSAPEATVATEAPPAPAAPAAREPVPPPRHDAPQEDAPQKEEKKKVAAWLWPALLAIAILAIGAWLLNPGDSKKQVATSPVAPATNVTAPTPARSANPNAQVSAALSSLKPGFSANELLAVLNLSVINFPTAGFELPASEVSLLQQAAALIKQLPPGSVVEIAGYTDNTGDSTFNVTLSQNRAEAIRTALVGAGVDGSALVAKGYGEANPVASNDTEDGRASNRRIEYHVAH
jgi:outer membrane protein OmpA-like peptidoglycan-associated protein